MALIHGRSHFNWVFSFLWAAAFALLSLSSTAFAQDQTIGPADGEMAQEMLIQWPQDKQQLLRELQIDIQREAMPVLRALAFSPSSDEVRLFVKGLEGQLSMAEMEKVFVQFQANQETYLKIIVAIADRIRGNPHLYQKMSQKLEILKENLSDRKVVTHGAGARMWNSSIMVGSWVSLIYSFVAAFVPQNLHAYWAASNAFMPQFFVFYLGLAVVAETKAFVATWKSWVAQLKTKSAQKKLMAQLRAGLKSLANSEEVEELVKKYKYLFSDNAQKAFFEQLPELSQRYLEQIEYLKNNPTAWQEMQKFILTKNYLALIEQLNRSLSEHDKQLLLKRSLDKTTQIPLALDMQMLAFEKKLLLTFGEFLDDGSRSSREEVRKASLELKEFYLKDWVHAHAPGSMYKVGLFCLTLQATILGVQASIGKTAMPIDSLFNADLIHWLRENSKSIFTLSGILSIPPIASFYLKFMTPRFFKKENRDPRPSKTAWQKYEGLVAGDKVMGSLHFEEHFDRMQGLQTRPHGYQAPENALDQFLSHPDDVILDHLVRAYERKLENSARRLSCSKVHF